MQTAIDRVIRSFTFRNALSLTERGNEEPAPAGQERAAERAASLLGCYRDTLAARSAKPD